MSVNTMDDSDEEETIEEILAREEFSTPEPTDDNPYPIPSNVLLGEDEFPKPIVGFWK